MKIDFKQLEFIEPSLRDLLTFVDSFGFECTITSLYRIGDSGVHGQLPLRGADVRCRDKEIGQVIQDKINAKFAYDPSRAHLKCCLLHGKDSNLHLHLQVHPNTVMV